MSNFSKYFPDEVNDSNWEVVAQKDGSYSILDGDGIGIANDITDARTAYMMANAQRFFNFLDTFQREIFLALMKAERAEEGKKK